MSEYADMAHQQSHAESACNYIYINKYIYIIYIIVFLF